MYSLRFYEGHYIDIIHVYVHRIILMGVAQ